MRQAIALAIDRRALAQLVAAPGLPEEKVTEAMATSAFPSNTPWGAAHPPLPTNTVDAAAKLDAAGWPLVNGVRTKNGLPLSLNLVYYTFRSDLVT